MQTREPIKNRDDKKPTPYYPAGKVTEIPDLGEFPKLLKMIWDGEVFSTFKLSVITADFVYYVDPMESDDTGNVIMLNRNFELVSNNVFGANDLFEIIQNNEGLLWMSRAVKSWQREEFVRPKQITPGIRTMLREVDIEKLSDKEKAIYKAFIHNGPVKYTKAESLMAVMYAHSSQGDYSQQLMAIREMLERNTKGTK